MYDTYVPDLCAGCDHGIGGSWRQEGLLPVRPHAINKSSFLGIGKQRSTAAVLVDIIAHQYRQSSGTSIIVLIAAVFV